MAALQCEICGGKLMAKAGGLFECEYCGMQYDKTRIQEMVQEIKGTVKVEGTVEVKGTVKVDGPVKVEGGISVENLLKRGWMDLEDRKWAAAEKSFSQALDHEPENCRAHLGRYLSEKKITSMKEAERNYFKLFYEYSYFPEIQRIRELADKELTQWFQRMDKRMENKNTRISDEEAEEIRAAEEERKAIRASLPKLRKQFSKIQNRVLATGPSHTVGLKSDGTVITTQYTGRENDYKGQCELADWSDITDIAVGYRHTVGLKSDGTVIAAGDNNEGQCDVSDWTGIVAVAAGCHRSMGLKADGTVVITGKNGKGQCNVDGWENIVAIAVGYEHVVGLKADGKVVAVGDNSKGQCDVDSWRKIVAIAVGEYHTVGLKSDGTVVAVGSNFTGQCDVKKWEPIIAIDAGYNHTVGLKYDGTVVVTKHTRYELYCGERETWDWRDIIAICAGGRQTVGIKADGSVVVTKYLGRQINYRGQCDVSDWKLFGRLETIEQEREAGRRKAVELRQKAEEARRRAEEEARQVEEEKRQTRIATLNKEKNALFTELSNLKGLFTGKRRKEIESRLGEIETELKGLS